MQDLIKVRMKLGVYAKQGFGYIQLEEPNNDGVFTVKAHLKGQLITNPRKLAAEYVFKQAAWCESEGCQFFPKYKPEQFGSIVNPKTGALYQEFTAEDWATGNTENFAPVEKTLIQEEHSEILNDFFNDWKK